MTLSTIDHCRVCHGPLEEVVAFGDQPLANGFNKPDVKYPLTFCHCTDCGLYQLAEVVDPDELFGGYLYRAGSGGMQQEMFHELATTVKHAGVVNRKVVDEVVHTDAIIDIGGNDGSLLKEFKGYARFNVDPYGIGNDKDQLGDLVRDQVVLVKDVWGANMTPVRGTKLILSTNSWAHIDNIQDAAAGVAEALADDGYFIIQTPWIRDLLHNTLYDTIYHEHLSYWGVSQLRRLFQAHAMDVVHVDYLPKVHGGSIRCWISKDQYRMDSTLNYFLRMEELIPTPEQFADTVERHKRLLQETLTLEEGRHWTAYGCSAKGVMLVNLAELDDYIACVVDDTQEKINADVPGLDLRILPTEVLLKRDHILLTAWNYADAIKAKLRKQNWHGTVVTPFPVPIKEYL